MTPASGAGEPRAASPPRNGPSHLLPYSRPLKGLGGLDRPPTAVTRPMASPASAVPFVWVPDGGVEAAVVGRVVDGQARRAVVGGAAAAGGKCGWWAPLGADSAHRGLTVHVCSGVIEGYRIDVAWLVGTVLITDNTGCVRQVTRCGRCPGNAVAPPLARSPLTGAAAATPPMAGSQAGGRSQDIQCHSSLSRFPPAQAMTPDSAAQLSVGGRGRTPRRLV